MFAIQWRTNVAFSLYVRILNYNLYIDLISEKMLHTKLLKDQKNFEFKIFLGNRIESNCSFNFLFRRNIVLFNWKKTFAL